MNNLTTLTLTILAGTFSTAALHAEARFNGTVGYKLLGDRSLVEVYADAIKNKSCECGTGTLQLQVWATHSPYDGGRFCGTVLGSTQLSGLRPGYKYDELCKMTSYNAPDQTGCYYVSVVLLEYRSSGWTIADYVNMPGKTELVGTCRTEPVYSRPVATRCEPAYAPRDVDSYRPLPGYAPARTREVPTYGTYGGRNSYSEPSRTYRPTAYSQPSYTSHPAARDYPSYRSSDEPRYVSRTYSRCSER